MHRHIPCLDDLRQRPWHLNLHRLCHLNVPRGVSVDVSESSHHQRRLRDEGDEVVAGAERHRVAVSAPPTENEKIKFTVFQVTWRKLSTVKSRFYVIASAANAS